MADFPTSIYAPRIKTNYAGVVYDPLKSDVGYAEDVSLLDSEVVSIETVLGLSPKWASASIAERIKGIRSLSDSDEAVITIKGSKVGINVVAPTHHLHVLGNAQIGNAFSYTPDGTLDVAVGSSSMQSRFLFGQSNTNYGGMIWNYNVTPASAYLSIFTSASNNNVAIIPNGTGKVGIGTIGPTAKLDIDSDVLRLRTAKTPATAGSAGNAGDICWSSAYLYVCIATNTWKRVSTYSW